MRQLHTYGAEFTLTCSTCQIWEHLGYAKPDVDSIQKLHLGHDMTLEAKALTFTSASKEDLEMMRCTGCSECERENK